MFELTVSLGNLLGIITVLITVIGAVWAIKSDVNVNHEQNANTADRLDKLESTASKRFDNMDQKIAAITDKLEIVVRQDERLVAFEQRLAAVEEWGRGRTRR